MESQLEWVHILFHSLHIIPMNWYLEIELHHGTMEWYILRDGFMNTLSFEDKFKNIDEALQEVKAPISIILQDPLELIQSDWSTQLLHALKCYNLTTKEEDGDPRNINIPKAKGHHKVEGPQIENLDITTPLKTKQVNIGTEVEPKFANIGDYWDDAIVDRITDFLCEYQDLFPTKNLDLKGIIGNLGVMKITLKLDVKPVKQRPYRLNPKQKEKVCLDLDKILGAGIIELVEESDWVSPKVVQEKKQKQK